MKKRDAKKVVNINDSISSDGEETGAQDLSNLTLNELEALFDRELGESDRLQAESDCLSRRSAVSLLRAGRVLAAIRDRLKSQRKWTEWQKDHKVGVTSAWQAIQLFEKAGSEAAIANLTRTEALIKFNITKPKPAPVAKGVFTKKCDKQVAQQKSLKLFLCDSQEEEQPTTDHAPVEQPKESEEPETPATQPVSTEATIPSVMAMEYLHKINLKLEEIERGLVGVTPDDHLLSLINQAIATLQRLRGDVPADIDAA
jgi:hypothetical protein